MARVKWRVAFVGLGIGLLLMVSVVRVCWIQLISDKRLLPLAVSQRCIDLPIGPDRGSVLDRNYRSLLGNDLTIKAAIFPSLVKPDGLKAVSSATGIRYEDLESRIERTKIPFVMDVAPKDSGTVFQTLRGLEGVIPFPGGRYGNDSMAKHVVGYTNGTENEGVSGIEGMLNQYLRGSGDLSVSAVVDGRGRLLPGLGYRLRKTGSPAHDVVLTIDASIQRIVEDVMDEKVREGAVVVLQPRTGEILAMASRPDFDQNRVSDYLQRSDAPLVNRAVQGYPPGSTFKVVVAAAALEERFVTLDEVFYCPGEVRVGGMTFKCSSYKDGGHGSITFSDGLAHSCNPVFIRVGQRLGAETIIRYARDFGIATGDTLGLAGEGKGNLPNADKVYPGDLANISIGQGDLLVTPLEMARAVAAIANDGVIPNLQLLKEVRDSAGNRTRLFSPSPGGTRVMSKRTALSLRTSLLSVTRSGSGMAAYIPIFGSAGKTGSAETGFKSSDGSNILHAWFAGFTPAIAPEYVICVLVERGGLGGEVAAPVFKEIAWRILGSR